MSARKRQPRTRARNSLLTQVMANIANLAMNDAWNAAWKAARAEELKNVTLHAFLHEFVAAMRAEIEKKAVQLEVHS